MLAGRAKEHVVGSLLGDSVIQGAADGEPLSCPSMPCDCACAYMLTVGMWRKKVYPGLDLPPGVLFGNNKQTELDCIFMNGAWEEQWTTSRHLLPVVDRKCVHHSSGCSGVLRSSSHLREGDVEAEPNCQSL